MSEIPEQLYRQVFLSAMTAKLIVSLDGIILDANDTARDWAPEHAASIGGPLSASPWFPSEAESGTVLSTMVRDATRGGIGEASMRLGMGAGHRHVDITARPLRIHEQITAVLVDARDVSRRVEAERALRESEATFAGILDIAADAIISVDEHFRIRLFNQGAVHIFGHSPSEMIGQTLDVLLPERFRATHNAHIGAFGRAAQQARRMGERREIFGLRADGEEFPAEASISRIDLPSRRLYTVVLRDITVRKRIEQNERFLAIAGERLGRTLELDQTIETAVDLPVDYLADVCILDLVEPGDRFSRYASRVADPALAEVMDRLSTEYPLDWDSPSRVIDVIRTGRPELLAEVSAEWLEAHAANTQQLTLVGRMRPQSLMIVPLRLAGRATGAMTLIRQAPGREFDRDDLALAESLADRVASAIQNGRLYVAAQRATRARDEVLGVVSHDLRNPLSAIAMCARGMLNAPGLPVGERTGQLRTVLDATEWMQRLIRDLLDVTSIDAGALAIERNPVDVVALLRRIETMFMVPARDAGLELTVEARPPLPEIEADGERLMQVLSNLVGNAIKFTPAGGRVTIRAARVGDGVELSVEDTGVGIAADELPRIFDRYWHARHGARQRGTGLGLAIARGIVNAHGGRLRVESERGEGTNFTAWIPLQQPDPDAED